MNLNPFAVISAAANKVAASLTRLANAFDSLAADVENRHALPAPVDLPALEVTDDAPPTPEPSTNGHGRKRVATKS